MSKLITYLFLFSSITFNFIHVGLPQVSFLNISFVFLVLIVLLGIAKNKKVCIFNLNNIVISIVLLTVVFSLNFKYSELVLQQSVIIALVCLCFFVSYSFNEEDIFEKPDRFIIRSVTFAFILNLYTLYVFYTNSIFNNLTSLRVLRFQMIRIFENTGGLNAFLNGALFLNIISIFLFFTEVPNVNKKYKLLAMLNIIFIVFTSLISGSRQAIFGLIFSIIIVLIFSKKGKFLTFKNVGSISLFIITILIINSYLIDINDVFKMRAEDTLAYQSTYGYSDARIYIWKNQLEYFFSEANIIFGISHEEARAIVGMNTHSGYISTLVRNGIIVYFLWIISIFGAIKVGKQLFKYENNILCRLFLIQSLLYMFINIFNDFAFYFPFYIIFGLSLRRYRYMKYYSYCKERLC